MAIGQSLDLVEDLAAAAASPDGLEEACAANFLTASEESIRTAKIMIVDDDQVIVKLVRKFLALSGWQNFVTTTDATLAMQLVTTEQPDVVLVDVMMPQVSGLDILRTIRSSPQTAYLPVLVLSATNDMAIKTQAIQMGAADFLNKPINAVELAPRVRNALLVKAHYDHLKEYARLLKVQVQRRTAELAASRLELIHCLARVAEQRDRETGRHVMRVGRYAGIIARQLGLDPDTVELLEHAAPLHDMGKAGIPDHILLKPGGLDSFEMEIMRRHSLYGKRTFEPLTPEEWLMFESHTVPGDELMQIGASPLLTMAGVIALTHHEKWDGSGYPHGLAGEDIPLPGRITAVADVFDALSNARPYKPAFPVERCFAILQEGSGSHFDPRVLAAFFAAREEILAIRTQLADADSAE